MQNLINCLLFMVNFLVSIMQYYLVTHAIMFGGLHFYSTIILIS